MFMVGVTRTEALLKSSQNVSVKETNPYFSMTYRHVHLSSAYPCYSVHHHTRLEMTPENTDKPSVWANSLISRRL